MTLSFFYVFFRVFSLVSIFGTLFSSNLVEIGQFSEDFRCILNEIQLDLKEFQILIELKFMDDIWCKFGEFLDIFNVIFSEFLEIYWRICPFTCLFFCVHLWYIVLFKFGGNWSILRGFSLYLEWNPARFEGISNFNWIKIYGRFFDVNLGNF